METWEWVLIGAAIAAAVVLAVAWLRIRRRRRHLKERFGPEYHRAVADSGTGGGESHLAGIEAARDELDLRTLPNVTRDRYLDEWRQLESRFVSDPHDATRGAERLLRRALEEVGYPSDDSDRIGDLVAVDHPHVAERYRHGQGMLERVDGNEATENLRKAMLDFRAVLEDVLQSESQASLAR